LGAAAGEAASKYVTSFVQCLFVTSCAGTASTSKTRSSCLRLTKTPSARGLPCTFLRCQTSRPTLRVKPLWGPPGSRCTANTLIFAPTTRFDSLRTGLASAVHRTRAVCVRSAQPRHPIRAGHERADCTHVRRLLAAPAAARLPLMPRSDTTCLQLAKTRIIGRGRAVFSRGITAKRIRFGAFATSSRI
jgi:hypothetical protein